MKKVLMFLAMSCMALLPLFAQQKPRVAVISIKNESEYWHGRLGPAIEDWLVDGLLKSGKFRVIERKELESVLSEQNLSLSGAVDARTAAQVGKILGCQMVIFGAVTDFSVHKSGAHGAFGVGFGVSKTTAEGTLNVRMVSTTTAEIVYSSSEKGEHSFSNVSVAGFGGGVDWDESQARQIFEPATKKIVDDIAAKSDSIIANVGSSAALEGKVAKVSEGTIYINLGTIEGVKPGDTFEVYRVSSTITDPDTGQVLGKEESRIGTFTVSKVVSDHLSAGTVSGSPVKQGDTIKKK